MLKVICLEYVIWVCPSLLSINADMTVNIDIDMSSCKIVTLKYDVMNSYNV